MKGKTQFRNVTFYPATGQNYNRVSDRKRTVG